MPGTLACACGQLVPASVVNISAWSDGRPVRAYAARSGIAASTGKGRPQASATAPPAATRAVVRGPDRASRTAGHETIGRVEHVPVGLGPSPGGGPAAGQRD